MGYVDVSDNFKLNYPITTDKAWLFWSSRHKLNRIKAIIAFSLNESNANDNLRRAGYYSLYRHKMLKHYLQYLNNPEMDKVPFSDLSEHWWEPK